jgi:hypothetical protein
MGQDMGKKSGSKFSANQILNLFSVQRQVFDYQARRPCTIIRWFQTPTRSRTKRSFESDVFRPRPPRLGEGGGLGRRDARVMAGAKSRHPDGPLRACAAAGAARDNLLLAALVFVTLRPPAVFAARRSKRWRTSTTGCCAFAKKKTPAARGQFFLSLPCLGVQASSFRCCLPAFWCTISS